MKFANLSAPMLRFRAKPKFSIDDDDGALVNVINDKLELKQEEALALTTKREPGEFELQIKLPASENITFVTIVPTKDNAIEEVTYQLTMHPTRLVRLSDPASDGSFLLSIALFYGDLVEVGVSKNDIPPPMQIGIDPESDSIKFLRDEDEIGKAFDLFQINVFVKSRCVVQHAGNEYFCIVGGDKAESYLTQQDKEASSSDISGALSDKFARQFAILGDEYSFALSERQRSDGTTFLKLSRLTRRHNFTTERVLRLARGSFELIEEGKAQRSLRVAQLMRESATYLTNWDKYANYAGELLLEKAREVGDIAFVISGCIERNRRFSVQCTNLSKEQIEALKSLQQQNLGLFIVKDNEVPEFIRKPKMTFIQFIDDSLKDEHKSPVKVSIEKVRPQNKTDIVLDLIVQKEYIDNILSQGHRLIYPYIGDVAQIKRARRARENIKNGDLPNQNLGLLIEGHRIEPVDRPKRKVGISLSVKEKVFPDFAPTLDQQEAVEIAVNTPDIALIQGPPGTGKTTIIAAIVERLNEIFSQSHPGNIRGLILLSGFQHDAVNNMLAHMKNLNGLPQIPKFGSRGNNDDDSQDDWETFEEALENWRKKQLEILSQKLQKLPVIKELEFEREFHDMCTQYRAAPSLELAISLLNKVSDRNRFKFVDDDLRERLSNELERLQAEQAAEPFSEPERLAVAHALRTTPKSFADDGPARARDALRELCDDIEDDDRFLLERAAGWTTAAGTPDFLLKLNDVKANLLACLTPRPIFRREQPRRPVLNLIDEALGAIKRNFQRGRDKKTAALYELAQEMENDPIGIKQSLINCSFAFAATCQQSVGQDMRQAKMIDHANSSLEYEYVIVDEA